MVKLFKNKVDITGVAVLLMAFFVAVGFKAAESMQTTQWYTVTISGDPDELENQQIHEETGTTSPPVFPCNGSGDICAVKLELEPNATFPSNMQQAEDASDVEVTDRSFEN